MALSRGSRRRAHRAVAAFTTVIAATLLITACTAEAEVTEPTPRPTISASPSAVPVPSAVPTPSATPSPEAASGRAPLSDLVLTVEGLDGAGIGDRVPERLAVWDPQACRTPENEGQANYYAADDPIWGAHVPVYEKGPWAPGWVDGRSSYPFTFHEDDGAISWVTVVSPKISTDRGIHTGSSEEAVLAAYPEAVVFVKGTAAQYVTYNVEGPTGRLVIEVTGRDFTPDQPREVWSMYLTRSTEPLRSFGGTDGFGFCDLSS